MEQVLLDQSQPDTALSHEEVLAALPQTIVQVDEDSRVVAVNRPEAKVFQPPRNRRRSAVTAGGRDQLRGLAVTARPCPG
jgi:hypothetical protein